MAVMTQADFAVLIDQPGISDAGYIETLADRRAITADPILLAGYLGDVAGLGTWTIYRRVSDIGTQRFSAMVEGVGVNSSKITPSLVSATVAVTSLAFDTTLELRSILQPGMLDRQILLGQGLGTSAAMSITDTIAGLGSGFTGSTATTGVGNTVATMMAATAAVQDGTLRGPFRGIVYPKQWTDFTTNLAVVLGAGTLQFEGGSQIAAVGESIGGTFMNIQYSGSRSVSTANAGADSSGFIFGPQGIVWGNLTPEATGPQQVVIGQGTAAPLLIRAGGDTRSAVDTIAGFIGFGAAIGLQNGHRIITDR